MEAWRTQKGDGMATPGPQSVASEPPQLRDLSFLTLRGFECYDHMCTAIEPYFDFE